MRIEATSDFEVEEILAAPTGGDTYEIKMGDTGEVINKQVVGRSAWLRVRWDRLKRELNVDRNTLPHVCPLSAEH